MLGVAGLAGALAEPVGIMPLITIGSLAFVAAGLVAFVTLARSDTGSALAWIIHKRPARAARWCHRGSPGWLEARRRWTRVAT